MPLFLSESAPSPSADQDREDRRSGQEGDDGQVDGGGDGYDEG